MRGSVGEGLVSDQALFTGELLKSRRELVRTLYEAEGHTVADESGRVTGNLLDSAGLTISMTNAAGILRSMEKDGWIERVVRGKRTFAVTLNPNNHVVKRLIGYFDDNAPEPDLPEAEDVPDPVVNDTSIVDAAHVADELLLRVVDILNTPTSEDLHHRLGEQTEYANTLRNRCAKMEQEIRELKTTLEAKDARIGALNREKTQLESNLRAALKQERSVVGSGIRALEKFMQEIPRGRN